MEINKIKQAAEVAKSKTTDKRWIAAIDKAVAGILDGSIIVSELVGGSLVTTENGSYMVGQSCQCRAAEFGQPCRHRAAVRLIEIAATLPQVVATKAATRIVRSVERDVVTGVKIEVVKCGGWYV